MPDLSITHLDANDLGYGRMGQEIVKSLRKLGVDFIEGQAQPAGTHLHLSVPTHLLKWYEGQRLVCFSMFESMHVPEAFRESIHEFDLFLVPSEQNRELFSRYHPNVQVVPLGVDPEVWKPTPREVPRQQFTFLHGGSGLRKGGDLAYRAFQMAFPDGSWGDGPEPWLIMKSPRPNDFFAQRVMQINGRIPAEDEVRLYETAHCYLQPSRGEGFGMQPLQAIVQGLPTILTDAHGHVAFSDYGWKIPATVNATPRGSFMLGDAGDWWEPDVDVLAEHMRWIYDNYSAAQTLAWDHAEQAHSLFTWDNTAKELLPHLLPFREYSGSGELVEPSIKKYRMVLNRAHTTMIAGHTYQWQPFTDYYVPADVKRIMFEAGYVDPECLTEDDCGLTDEQLERIEAVSGKESFCGTCGQQLNTRPTRTDAIEAAL